MFDSSRNEIYIIFERREYHLYREEQHDDCFCFLQRQRGRGPAHLQCRQDHQPHTSRWIRARGGGKQKHAAAANTWRLAHLNGRARIARLMFESLVQRPSQKDSQRRATLPWTRVGQTCTGEKGGALRCARLN